MIKFFKSRMGCIILSIIWGFGLACVFRKVCNGRKCIVYQAPDPTDITRNVYLHEDKCFKYKTKQTKCTEKAIEYMK